MNIYERQMKKLGSNLDQYSRILGIPKSIVKKMVKGNEEVTEDMEINNFLRKNLFERHQEIEKNDKQAQMEAINMRMEKESKNDIISHPKIKKLLEEHPESKELMWYLEEYEWQSYFKKYNVKGSCDLMRRYTFSCKTGKLKSRKQVGISTIERVVKKKIDEMGFATAYPLICQLYDCFELGNIKEPSNAKQIKNSKPFEKHQVSQELVNWYKNYDFRDFMERNNIKLLDFANETSIPRGSINYVIDKKTIPSEERIKTLKDFVSKFETQTVTMGQAKVFDIPVDENHLKEQYDNYEKTQTIDVELVATQEELLRNLLKDRLTEEEKTLIKIFGGKI